MSQITLPLLYLLACLAFGLNRLPQYASFATALKWTAFAAAGVGIVTHSISLFDHIRVDGGLDLSISYAVAMIGLQLALIGTLGAIEPRLRGMSAGLLGLAAIATAALNVPVEPAGTLVMTWQMQSHVLIALFSYGLLTAGAIVAVYALLLDRRLRSGRFASGNPLFAPLETTEKVLFAVTAAGFTGLLIVIISGLVFVEDLFAQHLVHKTTLSLIALVLFGVLLGGRLFAGWRGKRAVYLYLWGFGILGLAYFGSRVVLEQILGRSWG